MDACCPWLRSQHGLAAESTDPKSSSTRDYDGVIVLGDSLNDNGTFRPLTKTGKFTNGGGDIWTEIVSEAHGYPLNPAYIYDGKTFKRQPGGRNYAQSGTRIVSPEGMWRGVSKSLAWQVDRVLEHEEGDLGGELVLMDGGGPDIVFLGLSVVQGKLRKDPALAGARKLAFQYAEQAARVAAAEPKTLVLAKVGDFGNVPMFGSGEGPNSSFISTLSHAMNTAISRELEAAGVEDAVVIDPAILFNYVRAYPSRFGLFDASRSGVDPKKAAPTPTGYSANADPSTWLGPDADQRFLFADFLHLSTRGHAILAEHVLEALNEPRR